MRVLADAIREMTPYRLRIVDPCPNEKDRKKKLETIQAYALDLAHDFFSNISFPSPVQLKLIATKGFESTKQPFSEAIGVVTFLVRFSSLSQNVVELEVPFPVCRGQIYTPSIAIYGGKKFIISQGLIDDIVARLETIRPKIYNPYMKNQRIMHDKNIERPLFAAPIDPTGWSDLISERYL